MSRQLYIGIVFLINSFITHCPSFIILKTRQKYNRIISLSAVTLWDFILFSIPRIFGVIPSITKSALLGFGLPFLWHLILFDAPLWKRLLVPIINLTITLGIDCLCMEYIFLIIGGGYHDIQQQNEYFIAVTALYNMLLLVADILWVLIWQRIVDKKKNNYMILYLIVSLYQLILLSLFLTIRKNISAHVMWISLAFLLACFFIDILMYYFFRHIEKLAHTKAQILFLQLEQEAIREYQSAEKQNVLKLKTLRSEFVQQLHKALRVLQTQPQSGSVSEILPQSKGVLDKARQEFYSPSPVLNALFTIKSHRAQELGIDITVNCFHNASLNIDDIDLCSVTGNLIDNAIEACSQSNTQPKTVHASITQKANYLIIKVENTVSSDFTMPSSNRRTTKDDMHNHGIGLGLVKQICAQYRGSFSLLPLSKNTVCATAILNERTMKNDNSIM